MKNVHTEHCCKICGCRYGDEDCPVVLGIQEQSYPCGQNEVCGIDWTDCYDDDDYIFCD